MRQRRVSVLVPVNLGLWVASAFRPPLQDCGFIPGFVDFTGVGYWASYLLTRNLVDLVFVVNKILLGGAWLIVSLRGSFLSFIAGDGTTANRGLVGELLALLGPVYVAAFTVALMLFGIFTIARWLFTYNVTSGQRLVLVTLLALYLATSGGQMALTYDQVREMMARGAYGVAYEGAQAMGLSFSGPGAEPVPVTCDISDPEAPNFCTGFNLALGFLFVGDPNELFSTSTPQAFRDKYYSVPPTYPTEISPSTVLGWRCSERVYGDALLDNASDGVVRALQGYTISFLGLLEELIWLLFSTATLALFLAMGLATIFAVFAHFGGPLNAILYSTLQVVIGALIAGTMMGAMMGIILLTRDNVFFFVAASVLGIGLYLLLLGQVIGLIMQTTRTVSSSIGGLFTSVSLPAVTERIARAGSASARVSQHSPPSGSGPLRVSDMTEAAISGAEAGMLFGPKGAMVGAALAGGAALLGNRKAASMAARLERSYLRSRSGPQPATQAVSPLVGDTPSAPASPSAASETANTISAATPAPNTSPTTSATTPTHLVTPVPAVSVDEQEQYEWAVPAEAQMRPETLAAIGANDAPPFSVMVQDRGKSDKLPERKAK